MNCHRIKSNIADPYDIVDNPKMSRDISFLAGRMIGEGPTSPLTFEINHPAEANLGHWMGNIIPIVSSKMLAVMAAAGVANFQTFPVVLNQKSTGASHKDYIALNVIGLISAAKADESTWDVIVPGGDGIVPELVDFKELVLSASKIRDLNMFRLVENPMDVFISDRVLSLLTQYRPEAGWGITVYDVPVR